MMSNKQKNKLTTSKKLNQKEQAFQECLERKEQDENWKLFEDKAILRKLKLFKNFFKSPTDVKWLEQLFSHNVCTVSECIEACSSRYFLSALFNNVESLAQYSTEEDLKRAIQAVQTFTELHYLTENKEMLKGILKNFLIDQKEALRLIYLLKDSYWYVNCLDRLTQQPLVDDIFDYIIYKELHHFTPYERVLKNIDEVDQEIVEYAKINKCTYALQFDKETKKQLYLCIENNSQAQEKLKQLVECNIQNTFDFNSLKDYLLKVEKRNLLNI